MNQEPDIWTLADILRDAARDRPDRVALHVEESPGIFRAITYADLDERSNRAARGLLAAGVGPQDRVAYLDKNTPQFFDLLFGAAKCNAVTVAVNWRLAPPEVAYILANAEAKVLVVGSEFASTIRGIGEGTLRAQGLTTILQLADDGDFEPFESWLNGCEATDPHTPATADDVAFQLYTSGTTGLPKGAMTTNASLGVLLANASNSWGFDDDSVNLVTMPLFHLSGSGWALVGMYNQAVGVMLREVATSRILAAIDRFAITNALMVPAVIQLCLADPAIEATDFSSMRVIAYGGSPITDEVLVKAIQKMGNVFHQSYGLTETCGEIAGLTPAEHDPNGPRSHLLRSVGRPASWVELRVVDPETGIDRGVGDVGEVWVRAKTVTKGYWRLPEETARAISPEGWFRTGDAGYFDAEGYLFLHDRIKDMIISGGENIYPAEVENALHSHPDIADVAVIGVPDDRWGERVLAIVVPERGADVTGPQLIAYAKERLAAYKCPKSVEFRDTLPRNPSGKILKTELREPYWAGFTRRVH